MSAEADSYYTEDEEVQLRMRCGDNEVTLTHSNTGLKVFDYGDGKYDHCVYVNPDGQSFAFKPDDHLRDELIKRGFVVRRLPVPDEAAWNFHQDWLRARG